MSADTTTYITDVVSDLGDVDLTALSKDDIEGETLPMGAIALENEENEYNLNEDAPFPEAYQSFLWAGFGYN